MNQCDFCKIKGSCVIEGRPTGPLCMRVANMAYAAGRFDVSIELLHSDEHPAETFETIGDLCDSIEMGRA